MSMLRMRQAPWLRNATICCRLTCASRRRWPRRCVPRAWTPQPLPTSWPSAPRSQLWRSCPDCTSSLQLPPPSRGMQTLLQSCLTAVALAQPAGNASARLACPFPACMIPEVPAGDWALPLTLHEPQPQVRAGVPRARGGGGAGALLGGPAAVRRLRGLRADRARRRVRAANGAQPGGGHAGLPNTPMHQGLTLQQGCGEMYP